ncbi:MAG TPA: AAA family ATPase [Actinomycetota bacterium]|nr:AAA family ATPase [Actinomycetota bacterium]
MTEVPTADAQHSSKPADSGATETESSPLTQLLQPFSPLALKVRRVTGAVVGRPVELAAIQQELGASKTGRLGAVTVEGEPGIGKTRLLLAASDIAVAEGFTTISVAADEEIRGPFLLARSIVGSAEATSGGSESPSREAVRRSLDALTGRDEPGFESLPPDQKLLRTLDLGAVAIRALAEERPLAIFIDDLQWADDDSLRLLRYVVRSAGGSPIFLMLSIRPEELAFVNEAVNLLADMERLGLIRRLKLDRFTQMETTEFLRQILGGSVDPTGGAVMHSQAEGVPFVIEELAQTYRDAGMIQEIDRVWTLAKNADRLVPSSVRTLISRRAARLPDGTKAILALAAVLGRQFSLKDLQALKIQLGEGEATFESLDEALIPAVVTGLLTQYAEDSPADYGFSHEQVREFAAAVLNPARRRAIHSAIVELLTVGEPAAESLPLLAYHAKAAGDAPLCVRFSLQAIRNALATSAPEEVLRVIELALPIAATPQERVALLQARDEAFDMLRRPSERLETLAELAALAEALGDPGLETDVQLRRAAAFRVSEEWDQATALAGRVRDLAASNGDKQAELAASLELGQDLMRSAVGEGYTLSLVDVDADGAEEAYRRAAELAEELGDDASLAAASRELGTIAFAKVRGWFVERYLTGEGVELQRRIAEGETPLDLVKETPVFAIATEATRFFERALELYERIGDRRGAMSALIALAYTSWGPDIHFGVGAGRHIEEIRRVFSRLEGMTKESERFLAEAQMLFGVHVFSRAKVIPDLALSRGEDAHRHARLIGDRPLEFLAAGGTALAHLDLGDVDEAEAWIDRAAATAAESPTPFRARQLEIWRGMWRGAAGDAEGMRSHLERAVQLASEQGRPAARCEALALLALEAARLGAEGKDDDLLTVAEQAATEAKSLMELLPGHPPWGAQADAALSRVALARGGVERAVETARSAYTALEESLHEDAHIEVLLPVAEAMIAGGSEEESRTTRTYVQVTLAMAAQRTVDEGIRVRWLRGPVGRELVRLAGSLEGLKMGPGDADGDGSLDESDLELLRPMIEGLTNHEIAERLELEEEIVARRLAEIFARIGASSRAEATAFAFREKVV